MTKTGKFIELLKTALIILLTVSALVLAWQTELFSDIVRTIPFFGNVAKFVRGNSGQIEQGGTEIKEAARPLVIVVTDETGARYGVKYDTEARNAVYDRTSSILGEALGSASAPAEITEDEWREALSGMGVYFEYAIPLRLSVLDGWLGARMPETVKDVLLRRVFVAFGEDKSRIYYQDIERGLFFGADTASTAGKSQELDIYSSNNAVFAFETGALASKNAPYMLITHENNYPDVNVSSAGSTDELLQIILVASGHSEEAYTTYNDNQGFPVCVGTQFKINIDTSGKAYYRRTDELQAGDEEQTVNSSEMIEKARVIVAETIGKACGDAEVFYESFEAGEGGACSVFFGYYIAGGRMFLNKDAYAATVSFMSGTVTEIELVFRDFSFTGETIRLLPEIQAMAAAGGEFLLCYSDVGPETLIPSWVRLER